MFCTFLHTICIMQKKSDMTKTYLSNWVLSTQFTLTFIFSVRRTNFFWKKIKFYRKWKNDDEKEKVQECTAQQIPSIVFTMNKPTQKVGILWEKCREGFCLLLPGCSSCHCYGRSLMFDIHWKIIRQKTHWIFWLIKWRYN